MRLTRTTSNSTFYFTLLAFLAELALSTSVTVALEQGASNFSPGIVGYQQPLNAQNATNATNAANSSTAQSAITAQSLSSSATIRASQIQDSASCAAGQVLQSIDNCTDTVSKADTATNSNFANSATSASTADTANFANSAASAATANTANFATVAGNSNSAIVSSFTVTPPTIVKNHGAGDITPADLAAITLPTQSGTILIHFSFSVNFSDPDANIDGITLQRDGSTILSLVPAWFRSNGPDADNMSYGFAEHPGAGTHSYVLVIPCSSNGSVVTFTNISMTVQEQNS